MLSHWAGRVATMALILTVTACSDRNGTSTQPGPTISSVSDASATTAVEDLDDVAHAWAEEMFGVVETRAYYAERVDFEALRAEARSRSSPQGPSGLYAVAQNAVAALADAHSSFLSPSLVAGIDAELAATDLVEAPAVEVLDDGVGFVVLPSIEALLPSTAGDAYVAAVQPTLQTSAACGWIIDLRANRGGSVPPMLAAVAPLLGSGTFLRYRDRTNGEISFTIEGDLTVVYKDPAPMTTSTSPATSVPTTAMPSLPVALLTSRFTASAAEGIVIAFHGRPNVRLFGEPTRGVPTANDFFRLSDGSGLLLTTAVGVDRAGSTYEGAIEPDELFTLPVNDGNSERPGDYTNSDDAAAAARQWIAMQSACSTSR